jgi:putative restriction endonuclease
VRERGNLLAASPFDRLLRLQRDPHRFVINIALEKNVDAVIKARVNQNVFRNRAIECWNEKCAVTGCSLAGVLIAPHIKLWRSCYESNEWLNPCNGILLSPNIDKLFDRGLITFDNNGHIVFSSKLAASEAASLGITQECSLRWGDERHKPFLAYHRANVFQG